MKTGHCTNDHCTCAGLPRLGLRAFCPHWNAEQPPGDHHAESIRMWSSLPDEVRTRCLNHLRSKIPPDILERWRDEHARGMAIGSGQIRFHFEVGMVVRNILRQVVRDDELPLMWDEHDKLQPTQWDDYYYGALHGVVIGETGISLASDEPGPAFWKFALWVISMGLIKIK